MTRADEDNVRWHAIQEALEAEAHRLAVELFQVRQMIERQRRLRHEAINYKTTMKEQRSA